MATARKRRKKKKQNNVGRENAIIIALVVVSVLLFMGLLGFGGIVGSFFNSLLFSLFGLGAYLFPFLLGGLSIYSYIMRDQEGNTAKKVAIIIFYILLCLFLQLISGDYLMSGGMKGAMVYSRTQHLGGGIFGGGLEALFRKLVGLIGTYILDVAGMVICLVYITEKSFVGGLMGGGERLYSSSKDAFREAREERAVRSAERSARREQDRQMRMDKVAEGVTLNTLVGDENSRRSDGMRELAPENEAPVGEPAKDEDSYFSNTVIEQLNQNKVDFSNQNMTELSASDSKPPALNPAETNEPEVYTPVEPIVEEPETQDFQERPIEKAPKARRPRKTKESTQEAESSAAEIQSQLDESVEISSDYQFPPLELLAEPKNTSGINNAMEIESNKTKLQETLKSFGVDVTVTGVEVGPAVTRYEIQPQAGVKVSKILGLTDDLKLALAAADIRMEAPIPGKSAIGIEVPNSVNVSVPLRELIDTTAFKNHKSRLAFAAGKDISGSTVIADIAKMPHLLIAGATGSGKSVCINSIIMSILYHATPEEVRLIMIDPKVVELSVYNGIPHLLVPVVTDPKKAAGALSWAVREMTERYQKFAKAQVRDLEGYNRKVLTEPESTMDTKPLPKIVVIVDELADLMMVASKDVEDSICRLAQLARACGIHLIIATQRPSVNVITGLIKANMPSRIAFAVSSGVDSRTILDMNGAEKLLGKGDMLYYPQGLPKPKRVQGTFVDDREVASVVNYITQNNSEAQYDQEADQQMVSHTASDSQISSEGEFADDDRDELFAQAGRFIIESDKASIGSLQRKFRIGFNRAARIMDQLSEAEVVGPEEGTKPRQILMDITQFESFINS